jgi:hypothetical protein
LTEQAASFGSAACFASRPSSIIFTISPTISTYSPSLAGWITALDQTTQDAERFIPEPGVGQRLVQPLDLAPVDLGQIRVEPHRGWGVSSKIMLERRLARLQFVQLLLQPWCAVPSIGANAPDDLLGSRSADTWLVAAARPLVRSREEPNRQVN